MSTFHIEETRGPFVESRHAVSVAVARDDGQITAFSGDPSRPTFMRSAAKPFQAIPLVADGVVGHFGLTDEDLALACASHSSEPQHVERVRALLQRIGCREQDLVCGPHRPLSVQLTVRPAGAPAPGDATPRGGVFSNCSGKHAGMLALARRHGWPISGYERATHPVQARCRREIARWTGLPEQAIGESIDGCGVICFRAPLDALATAFARLGTSDDEAPRAIRVAMMGRPQLVAGRHRLCTELMEAYPGRIVAKVGAAGVYGASLPARGLGVALKVEDGDARAAMIAMLAVLDALEFRPSPRHALPRFATIPIQNTRSDVVGELRPVGELTFA